MHHEIEIIGNVGRDPESRFTPSGAQVTSFSVAANRSYTESSGEKVKETCWFRISVWGRDAENCAKYVKKGMQVFVKGRLKPDPDTGSPRIWTDNSGQSKTSFEVTASTVRFLSRVEPQEQDAGDMLLPEDVEPF